MSFEDFLINTVSIYRKTDELFSGAIAASITLTHQPPSNSVLFLTVSNLVGSGTLTVTGVVAGSADTEAFAFTADGFKQGSKEFTSVASITNSGITSGTLVVTAITSGGTKLYVEALVESAAKVRIVEKTSDVTVVVVGATLRSELIMYCLADTDVLENDVVIENSTRYLVMQVIGHPDSEGIHHKTAKLKLEATSAT